MRAAAPKGARAAVKQLGSDQDVDMVAPSKHTEEAGGVKGVKRASAKREDLAPSSAAEKADAPAPAPAAELAAKPAGPAKKKQKVSEKAAAAAAADDAADGDAAANNATGKAAGKGAAKRQKKEKKTKAGEDDDEQAAAGGDSGLETQEASGAAEAGKAKGEKVEVKTEGRAARKAVQKVKTYKEAKEEDSDGGAEGDDERVDVVEEAEVATEAEALQQTAGAGPGAGAGSAAAAAMRSLVDFDFTDSEGRSEPIERHGKVEGGLFISGCVYPAMGYELDKAGRPKPTKASAPSKGAKAGAVTASAAAPAGGVKALGRRVSRVGPITSWRVSYSPRADPMVIVHTAAAQYVCGRPAPGQAKAYMAQLEPQLGLADLVYKALTPAAGGSMDTSFEDVCVKVARTKAKMARQYGGAELALQLNGGFILEQLKAMAAAASKAGGGGGGRARDDKGKGPAAGPGSAATYDDGPFAQGLLSVMNNGELPESFQTLAMLEGGGGGGIRIASDGGAAATAAVEAVAGAGGGSADADADADRAMALRLQAEFNAAWEAGEADQPRGRGRGGPAAGYIQIREEEIADDYPAPKEYRGCLDEEDAEADDECDEVVVGAGFGMHPDDMVEQTLDDFAFYNADGMMCPMETVPLMKDLQLDTGIFASGVVGEGNADWGASGGSGGSGGSGSGAGGSAAGGGEAGGAAGSGSGSGSGQASGGGGGGGLRIFTTQVREWEVEASADHVSIIIITDYGKYRLLRPHDSYAAWHRVLERCFHVTLKVVSWLAESQRASKLSFPDIVSRLAALGPEDRAYVPTRRKFKGAKAEAVERFVTVHGQVLLTVLGLIKKALTGCGFAKALKEKLTERRHRVLGAAGGKGAKGKAAAATAARLRSAVENPVKNRVKKAGGRPVAMPATTTAQVRRIWSEAWQAGHLHVHTAPAAAVHLGADGDVEMQEAAGAAAEGAAGAGGAGSAGGASAAGTTAAGLGEDEPIGPPIMPPKAPKVTARTWELQEPQPVAAAAATSAASVTRTLYGAAVCGDLRLTPGCVIRVRKARLLRRCGEAEERRKAARGSDSSEGGSESDDDSDEEMEEDSGEQEDGGASSEDEAESVWDEEEVKQRIAEDQAKEKERRDQARAKKAAKDRKQGKAPPTAEELAPQEAKEQAEREEVAKARLAESWRQHVLRTLTRGVFALVQAIYTVKQPGGKEGSPQLQVRRLVHGRDTMLGTVAYPGELFLLDPTPRPDVDGAAGGPGGRPPAWGPAAAGELAELGLNGRVVAGLVDVVDLSGRTGKAETRLEDAKADKERQRNDALRMSRGEPPVMAYRSVYCPRQGMFRALRPADLALGSYVQAAPADGGPLAMLPNASGFTTGGVTYKVGGYMFVSADAIDAALAKLGTGSEAEGKGEGTAATAAAAVAKPGAESKAAAGRKQQPKGKQAAAAAKPQGGQGPKSQRKAAAAAAAAIKKKRHEDEDEEEEEEEEEADSDDEKEEEDAVSDASGSEHESEDGDEEDEEEKPKKKKKGSKRVTEHKGSSAGMRAWVVVQLLKVVPASGSSKSGAASGKSGAGSGRPATVKVRRFFRPEDISADVRYAADWWDLYAPAGAAAEQELEVPVAEVHGTCAVVLGQRPKKPAVHTYVVVGTYDPSQQQQQQQPGKGGSGPGSPKVGPPPARLPVPPGASVPAAAGKEREPHPQQPQQPEQEEEEEDAALAESLRLATMDIFAGCGGLSEGFHQAGVAESRWAIEYDRQAADAFKLNNPDATVFCDNCNVLLRAAMVKAGQEADCVCDPAAVEAARALDPQVVADLPPPGSVGLMMGGPPCQGYSGMNRFNKGMWSQVQNSMVMAYTSYCDFYRPRYFLLENVRNFVSYNKGRVFRLVVRTLLELGYQVRFGVLNAGNYGVAQSRKRTFIWAALPGELLPDWPAALHRFKQQQLGVCMRGVGMNGEFFHASGPPASGAPLRTVTVRDVIGDLPPVENGACAEPLPYTSEPVSAFQRAIRGGGGHGAAAAAAAAAGTSTEVRDHVVKAMNALNLERCRCIPKGEPGADWRVLLKIVAEDPSREKFNGQPLVPWCLPNTAAHHNGWRGLYSRLDPDGHFPTATTDPNPMGKVGQVFHPDQDRIVSVRECARSQGFPDHFRFSGNVVCRHRQVGNAVPPPLARALGLKLREALKERRDREAAEAEAAMKKAMRARRQVQQQQQQQQQKQAK
ncbi:hypothetical protein HYH02_005516 [Chlamydomonas schloesseri]|uniref:DNA (cytosine-5-)-methyltransferase n=1 Tax=Chlamydomonas schloesseri TaxID=2026947 RepID=A0A836B725_9CHLO|nr:hypothetical protein HYH02_005516 [Chlamydomonas schloesseri]|eukprot:KAG2449363.1 hypothetical protein HYH02_005516 [Chlamydomonas schloesseri]